MHRLLVPAALHELHGQPVEQFGMGRRRSLGTEILTGFDDAAAEVDLPDLINPHPRRQRIVSADQPCPQTEPILWTAGRERAQERGHMGLDFLTLLRPVAANTDDGSRMRNARVLRQDERGRDLERG